MAAVALRAEIAIVHIVSVMTASASLWRIYLFTHRALMALIAVGNIFVRSGQFKVGLVVIEIPRLPATRVVALLTLGAKATLVYLLVILLMARPAFGLGIFESHRSVAFLALHRPMASQQGELGHGVVLESSLFPIQLVMASFAFLALLPFVLVVLLVTRQAGGLQLVFVQVSLVAAHAFHRRTMLAQQRKFGLFIVIEENLFPIAFDVTTFTLRPEVAFVRLVVFLFVTRHASHL